VEKLRSSKACTIGMYHVFKDINNIILMMQYVLLQIQLLADFLQTAKIPQH